MDQKKRRHIHPRRARRSHIDASRGKTDPAAVYVPHPVQDRTDDELRAMAERAFAALVRSLETGSGG